MGFDAAALQTLQPEDLRGARVGGRAEHDHPGLPHVDTGPRRARPPDRRGRLHAPRRRPERAARGPRGPTTALDETGGRPRAVLHPQSSRSTAGSESDWRAAAAALIVAARRLEQDTARMDRRRHRIPSATRSSSWPTTASPRRGRPRPSPPCGRSWPRSAAGIFGGRRYRGSGAGRRGPPRLHREDCRYRSARQHCCPG